MTDCLNIQALGFFSSALLGALIGAFAAFGVAWVINTIANWGDHD